VSGAKNLASRSVDCRRPICLPDCAAAGLTSAPDSAQADSAQTNTGRARRRDAAIGERSQYTGNEGRRRVRADQASPTGDDRFRARALWSVWDGTSPKRPLYSRAPDLMKLQELQIPLGARGVERSGSGGRSHQARPNETPQTCGSRTKAAEHQQHSAARRASPGRTERKALGARRANQDVLRLHRGCVPPRGTVNSCSERTQKCGNTW